MQAIWNIYARTPAALRYLATFTAGAGAGAGVYIATIDDKKQSHLQSKEDIASLSQKPLLSAEAVGRLSAEAVARTLAHSEKKLLKMQRSTQEIIQWKATDQQMLGLSPRLWMEVFDKKHRYASLVYVYWRRWQLSDSNDHFWDWLDHGMGSLIDLPEAPRRLLHEWHVIYLNRKQQKLLRVVIDPCTGRFHWEADLSPVTLPQAPAASLSEMTRREQSVTALLQERLGKSARRDEMLAAARQQVEAAIVAGEEASPDGLAAITGPLIQESLLCQLRDPWFAERHDAAPTPLGHSHHRTMGELPETLLPGIGWQDVLRAIDHDQGLEMNTPLVTGEDRLRGNAIFVLDSFGPLYCGPKIRGILQHSSFVRGHCVKVAGGIVLKDGWLVELSPHSGHYQPGQETVEEMIDDWRAKGVDFSNVELKPFQKMK